MAVLVLLATLGLPLRASRACEDFAAATSSRWSLRHDIAYGWRFITPCGDAFLSLGVNAVEGGPPWREKDGRRAYNWASFYPSQESWAEAARSRLRQWGFNTAGAWSAPLAMPSTPVLHLGLLTRFVWTDPFASESAAALAVAAREAVARYRGDPHRIGYFSDNEIGWWNGSAFLAFFAYPESNRTKRRLVGMLEERYRAWPRFLDDFVPPRGVASFEDLLRSRQAPHLRAGGRGIFAVRAWTEQFAERYYEVVSAALHAADPDALVLGDRLPIYYDPDAVRAMARHVDVVSVNYNVDSTDGWVGRYFFDRLSELTGGKPVLVTEWFFAAAENRSGNRNRTGPPLRADAPISHNRDRTGHLATVATQAERAAGAAAAARQLLARPEIVGLHWFQYFDHPRGGRDDGEDYDFGLVDIDDRPYEALVAALGEINRAALALPRGPPTRDDLISLPHATIDIGDGTLREWPKPASLLPLQTAPGEAPFADLHAAWDERGLFVAVNAMDYYDPDLLADHEFFPIREAFRVAIGVDGGRGPRRFFFRVVPEPAGRGPGGEHKLTFRLAACSLAAESEAECSDPEMQHLGARYFGVALDQPRVMAEFFVPWQALGLTGAPLGQPVRLEMGLDAFYRSRWMSLSGAEPASALKHPTVWRQALLGH